MTATVFAQSADAVVPAIVAPSLFSVLKVSVIIPGFNEEKRIAQRLACITDCFSRFYGGDYEIIVVADGNDQTDEIASDHARKADNLLALSYPDRLGKGGAIVEALDRARGEILVITDADDSVPPEDLLKLVEETKTCDLAIGSRYRRDSKLATEEPFLRYLLGRGFNVCAKLMFWKLKGLSDTQCGAKAVRAHAIARVRNDLFITGFAFDVNLILSLFGAGFKIAEIGVAWSHCKLESKVSGDLTKLVAGMFFSLIRLRIYYSRAKPILQTRVARKAVSLVRKYVKS
jgi:glycosyltransferase involved in cell wall biosynthesis